MPDGEQRIYELARAAQKKAALARRRRPAQARRGGPASAGQSPRQRLGQLAEEQARRHLEAAGAIFLCRNLRCKSGEIDLVFLDRGTLAFVEVRRRGTDRYGGAAASVNRPKQQRLIRAARYFLPAIVRRHCRGRTPPCRFDVVTLDARGLAWHKHAFAQD